MRDDGFDRFPVLAKLAQDADHITLKNGTGDVPLTALVAGILSYEPQWMAFLWKVRTTLMQALGQGKGETHEKVSFTGDTLPIQAGEYAGFFKVDGSDGSTYWAATGVDKHLSATIGVTAESLKDGSGQIRYAVYTFVHYTNWAGPVYFNIIRPFHHLVVKCAMQSALTGE